MKTKLLKLSLLFLALCLCLGGCSYAPEEETNTQQDKTAEYLNTIATLEGELEEQKTLFLESEALYKQLISELEQKLAQLSATQPPLQESEDSVQFRYRVEEGGAVITGYQGNVALLSIPDTLDGYPVIAIGERAFEGATITAVVFPDGIQDIGWFAFYNCHGLINVTLPASVCSIGYAVFDGCGTLTLYCPKDSYAERYARSYGISYVTV